MKNKSILLTILVVIITILVVVFFNKEKSVEKNIEIVTNPSNFYTVNSCMYRVISYASTKDKKSLMLTLDESYAKKNKITINNVLNLFENVLEDSTFVSTKMYYEEINKEITKYYVYGYIQANQLADGDVLKKLDKNYNYYVVYLNKNKSIFSFAPYAGEIFTGGDSNEK